MEDGGRKGKISICGDEEGLAGLFPLGMVEKGWLA